MSLNIKSEETHRMARELAELTGESMSAAVTKAVQERRDRLRTSEGTGLAARLLAIGRDTAARLPDTEHGRLLYGDDGLPR